MTNETSPDRLAKNLFTITIFGAIAFSVAAYVLTHSGM